MKPDNSQSVPPSLRKVSAIAEAADKVDATKADTQSGADFTEVSCRSRTR
jgi:hypothetical protein